MIIIVWTPLSNDHHVLVYYSSQVFNGYYYGQMTEFAQIIIALF